MEVPITDLNKRVDEEINKLLSKFLSRDHITDSEKFIKRLVSIYVENVGEDMRGGELYERVVRIHAGGNHPMSYERKLVAFFKYVLMKKRESVA